MATAAPLTRLLLRLPPVLVDPAVAPTYRIFARCLSGWAGAAPSSAPSASPPVGAGAEPAAASSGTTSSSSSFDEADYAYGRQTIFALSSGQGRSALAVIRLSGPGADAALVALLPPGRALPPPRSLALAMLRHPADPANVLDKAMVLRFPGPRSFTGEDCAELHVHGGPAVVRCVLGALGALPWARPAEPGEFSRRAFEGGKLDLTEVEGLADLLQAETEWQRRQALAQSGGTLRRQYEAWRGTLLTCLARVEAVIDFGEDEEIADDVAVGVVPLARQLREELERHLGSGASGELVREGVQVALLGPPNAGKSSLLNALAGRDAAIVSPLPGTTRDTLEVALDLGGYKVLVTDCAGLRSTDCPVEAEGVRRALRAAQRAHIVVRLHDAAQLLEEAQQQLSSTGGGRRDSSGYSEGERGGSSGCMGDAAGELGGRARAEGDPLLQQLERLLSEAAEGELDPLLQPCPGAPLNISSTSRRPVLLPVLNKLDLVEQRGLGGADVVLAAWRQWQQAQRARPHGDVEDIPLDGAMAASATAALRGASGSQPASLQQQQQQLPAGEASLISCATGAGLDALLARLTAAVGAVVSAGCDPAAAALTARARHRHHVAECVAALRRYEAAPMQLEIAAEELRGAARALGRVTGAVDVESVLGEIFATFCCGK